MCVGVQLVLGNIIPLQIAFESQSQQLAVQSPGVYSDA